MLLNSLKGDSYYYYYKFQNIPSSESSISENKYCHLMAQSIVYLLNFFVKITLLAKTIANNNKYSIKSLYGFDMDFCFFKLCLIIE